MLAYLYLGRAVCGSSTALKKIVVCLLFSRNKGSRDFTPTVVLRSRRDRILSRYKAAEIEGVPELSIQDVTVVEKGRYVYLYIFTAI